ncbi:hypothetical protein [Streptomyces hygroscopicus]|uniref:hypothetical protein n=1 Tax=Streptomyces hygroscopicus TaxID=1912 RepID=UPI0033CDB507
MTTDRPYTDADLRAEAARQLKNAGEDPDFGGIGEQMEGHKIPSRNDVQWDQLGEDDFDTATRAVDDLLTSAADVSTWAVDLGADGLEPDEHQLTWRAGPQPIVRVHFAFHAGMSDEARDHLVQAVGEALGGVMDTAAQGAEPTD